MPLLSVTDRRGDNPQPVQFRSEWVGVTEHTALGWEVRIGDEPEPRYLIGEADHSVLAAAIPDLVGVTNRQGLGAQSVNVSLHWISGFEPSSSGLHQVRIGTEEETRCLVNDDDYKRLVNRMSGDGNPPA